MRKKIVSLVLALAMLLSLCAMSVSAAGESTLKVGFGREDITPDYAVPLAGYGNTAERMSQGTITPEDHITVTAIAISDGEQTNLLFTMDLIRTPTTWGQAAQQAIAKKTGVPADRISISAIHTHSAPDVGDDKELTSDSAYYTLWLDRMVKAAEKAVADLAAVTSTKYSVTKVEGMNWMRHWRRSDGTYGGDNFSNNAEATYKGHPRETDQDLQVIRFDRGAGKQDVVLVNWQGHATKASSSSTGGAFGKANNKFISADYPGYMRRYVEKEAGVLVAFFLGASGNVNCYTKMASLLKKWEPPQGADVYGEKLGKFVIEAMANMTEAKTGKVTSARQEHVAMNATEGMLAGSARNMQQDVVTVGKSIAFVTAGYEMFDINGMDIKQASPYDITFVLTCTQGHEYMPSWEATNYTILPNGVLPYEARKAQCNVAYGTGEDLADALVAMLNKLYK